MVSHLVTNVFEAFEQFAHTWKHVKIIAGKEKVYNYKICSSLHTHNELESTKDARMFCWTATSIDHEKQGPFGNFRCVGMCGGRRMVPGAKNDLVVKARNEPHCRVGNDAGEGIACYCKNGCDLLLCGDCKETFDRRSDEQRPKRQRNTSYNRY